MLHYVFYQTSFQMYLGFFQNFIEMNKYGCTVMYGFEGFAYSSSTFHLIAIGFERQVSFNIQDNIYILKICGNIQI